MYHDKQILAIIPARGGSRGIPRKNIRLLNGKPLIAYTIESALNSELIDRVIVSTEDKEIVQISEKSGAEVIKRPEELAGDDTSTEDVLKHVVVQFEKDEKYTPDIIVLLQCTSPLRERNDIDNAIKKMIDSGADSLLSVCDDKSFFWKLKNDLSVPINYNYNKRPKRQETQQFRENGSIYVFKRKILMEHGSRLGGKIQIYVMKKEDSFEIDEPFDFWLVEQILRLKKNEEGKNW